MKQETHPTYYSEAKVTCNGCGRTYTVGSSKESLTVELCSNCHPFYTGKQKLVDTAGRVDRYRARAAKAAGESKPKTASKPKSDSAKTSDTEAKADSPSPEERLTKMKAELSDDSKDQSEQ